VASALRYDFETAAPINIIRRQIDREPKILSLDLGDVLAISTSSARRPSCGTGASIIGSDVSGRGRRRRQCLELRE
jgi:hypothetical protein